MSGRRVGTAQATAIDHTGSRAGLAIALGAILLAGGLLALAGTGSAAPEDPPSVKAPEDMRTAFGQTLVLQAQNMNNDDSVTWGIDVPSGVTVENTRTSSDELSFWARLAITDDAPDHFTVTFTATDGQGNSDSASTDLDPRADGSEADLNALTDTVTEDTDEALAVDVDPLRRTVTDVSIDKNYLGGKTKAATNTGGTAWEATFNYEYPSIHTVGYKTLDDRGLEVILVDDLDVAEKAPELSTAIDEIDTAVGQRISFEISATDSDGESFDLNVTPGDEFGDTKLVQDGNTARFAGTIAENIDGIVYATFTADDGVATSSKRVTFNIGDDPDIFKGDATPDSVLEDTDVTLRAHVDTDDLDASTMTVFKNFEWDGDFYLDKSKTGSTQVDSNTWDATFNYAQPALHHPGYQVELADGNTVTLVTDLDVLEQAPDLTTVDFIEAAPGQTVGIVAEASDSDNEEIVRWEVTDDGVGGTVTELGDTAVWEYTIPDGADKGRIDLRFEAEDSQGAVSVATPDLRIREDPLIEPDVPMEVDTQIEAITPITGWETAFRANVDDTTNFPSLDLVKNWPDLSVVKTGTEVEEGRFVATATYALEGEHRVGYMVTDTDGGQAAVIESIYPQDNTAPDVEAGPEQVAMPGDKLELRAHAGDPEGRYLDPAEYEWHLVDAPADSDATLGLYTKGHHEHATFDEIGTYTFELRVTDPYGATGTDTVDLHVDDAISATAHLTNAEKTGDRTYQLDPFGSALETIDGVVNVTNTAGDAVDTAEVTVESRYYGSSTNTLVSVTEDVVQTQTDSTGQASFEVDQTANGAADRGETLISAPGYHELVITVSSDSAPNAPIQDTETTTLTLGYWVQP